MNNSQRLAAIFFCLGSATLSGVSAQSVSPLAGKIVHVFQPLRGDSLFIDLKGAGYPVHAEGDGWYRLAFADLGNKLVPAAADFFFRDLNNQLAYGRGGLGTNVKWTAADFAGSPELWIIEPTGNPKAAPILLTSAPRQIHLLNPWPENGPALVVNGTRRGMLVDPAHCGWYRAFLVDAGPVAAHFVSVSDGAPFGKTGRGDATDLDLTSRFSTLGPQLWIGDSGTVTGTFPQKEATCGYLMAATVHDMASTHPDFTPAFNGLKPGLVAERLGPDRKPVGTSLNSATFNTWFNSDSTRPMPLTGYQSCVDIAMGKSNDGLWEYDSYDEPSHAFFPINDRNRLDKNEGDYCYNEPVTNAFFSKNASTNFGFCMESHATFTYRKGQVFDFRGDDDVWVFIDGKLALDLGGTHSATPGSIGLDTLGLIEGRQYPWDFFFCERRKCGSSLRIKTTIYFQQQRALDHAGVESPAGGMSYSIIKRIGGTGACGSSQDSVKITSPSALTYVLETSSGTKVQDLGEGNWLGGIDISTPKVTVDTSRISALPPGTYRIVYFEPSNPTLRDEVGFTVVARVPPVILPELVIPKLISAAIFDDDADGVGDRLVARFDKDPQALPPKSVEVKWPSSASPQVLSAKDFPGVPGGDSLRIALPWLSGTATSGSGTFTAAYAARDRDSLQSVPIQDRMAPVLVHAEMIQGHVGQAFDTLRLGFSEPVVLGAVGVPPAAPRDLFQYTLTTGGPTLQFDPVAMLWNSGGSGVDLIFPSASGPIPRSGNLIRIMEGSGRLADKEGNGVGANSRFRLISGTGRSEILTVTYKEIDADLRNRMGPGVAPTLEPLNADVKDVVSRTGMQGHLIKIDLGSYAGGDDFHAVDPSSVRLEYDVAYFTNFGTLVSHSKGGVSCVDSLFGGDCRAKRGFLFVGWNYIAQDGQKVATGAYVARLRYTLQVSGKVVETGGLDQIWGVIRTR